MAAAIIVHGGSYTIPSHLAEPSLRGCEKAALEAHRALLDGKSALDAGESKAEYHFLIGCVHRVQIIIFIPTVEIAVKLLEDDPTFNAGHGSSLNVAGEVEMDAMIMDGGTLNCGAVAGVRNIANPVSLARMVMEKTNHIMLMGSGANKFAKEMGVPEVDPSELVSDYATQIWEDSHKYATVVKGRFNDPNQPQASPAVGSAATGTLPIETHTHPTLPSTLNQKKCDSPSELDHDTVGAVAMDLQGHLAAATSTGGISLKRVGRVGDSPLVGCGAYCDDKAGGVSCTGHGESIAKVVLAQRALFQLSSDGGVGTPQKALEDSLEYMWRRVGGRGGMIMITKTGEIAKSFTTMGMAWASVCHKGILESSTEKPRLAL